MMSGPLQSLILLSIGMLAFGWPQQGLPSNPQLAFTYSVNQQRTDKGISTEYQSTVNERYDAAPQQPLQQQQQQTQFVNEQVIGTTNAFSRSLNARQNLQLPEYSLGVPDQQQYRQQ